MGFGISYQDIDDMDDIGGKERVSPGGYHFLIEAVNEDGENNNMVVDLQVLRGSVAGQENKQFRLNLKKDYGKWPQRKLAAFAIATRLRTKEKLKENAAKHLDDNVEWTEAVGRTICMKLTESDDGKYINLDWDSIWSPDDKRANWIPLHKAALERDGIKLPENRPLDGVLATAAKQKSQPAKKPSVTSTDDILDGVF